MTEYKRLSKEELQAMMENIRSDISLIIDQCGNIDNLEIVKENYRTLKTRLKPISKYVSLDKNKVGPDFYIASFTPFIVDVSGSLLARIGSNNINDYAYCLDDALANAEWHLMNL